MVTGARWESSCSSRCFSIPVIGLDSGQIHNYLLVETRHQASDHQRIDLADIANVDGVGELDVFEKHPMMRLRRRDGCYPTFDTKFSMLSGCR